MATINLGNGNVTVTENVSNTTITAGSGIDNITVNGSSDILKFGSGNDIFTLTGDNESIFAGNGNDTITITGVASGVTGTIDNINIGTGTDFINIGGVTYINKILAGNGENTIMISGTSHQDTILVGNGQNIIVLTDTGTGDVIMAGNGGNYILANGTGNSVQSGGGNDTLVYNASDILLNGGGGFDTLLVNAHQSAPIDLTPTNSPVTNFQVIDLTGDALQNLNDPGNTLILNLAAVEHLTGASINLFNNQLGTLAVMAGYHDILQLGPGWTEHDVLSGANLTAFENLLVGNSIVSTPITLSEYRDFTQGGNTIIVNEAPPQANPDTYALSQNGIVDSLAIAAPAGVLANDFSIGHLGLLQVTQLDGVNLVGGSMTENTAHGMVTLFADGHFMYTDMIAFTGDDTFTYMETDDLLSSTSPTTVTIAVTDTVTPVILAITGPASEPENTTNTPATPEIWQVNLGPTVLQETYSYALVPGPSSSDFMISSTGEITQTGAIDENAVNGTIVLGVQVTDTISHLSAVQNLVINVTDPDFDSTATLTPSTPNVGEGASGAIATLSQAHPNGDDVYNQLFSVTDSNNNNVTSNFSFSNGMLSIITAPEEGTFSYTVVMADSEGDHSQAIPLTIVVADPDFVDNNVSLPAIAPVVAPDPTVPLAIANFMQDNPQGGDDFYNILTSVTLDGGTNNLASDFTLSNGQLILNPADGSIITPGSHTLDIVVQNQEGNSVSANTSFIGDIAPVANPVTINETESSSQHVFMIPASEVLAQDTHVAGTSLSVLALGNIVINGISAETNADGNSLAFDMNSPSVDPNGQMFIYTINNPDVYGPNFTPDSFNYAVSDGILQSNVSTITFNVTEADIPPTAITVGGHTITPSFTLSDPALTPTTSPFADFGMLAALGANADETFSFTLSENNNNPSDPTQYFGIAPDGDLVLENPFAMPTDVFNPITLTITATDNFDHAIFLQENLTADILTAPSQITDPSPVNVVIGTVGTGEKGAVIAGNDAMVLGSIIGSLNLAYNTSIASAHLDTVASVIPDPNIYTETLVSPGVPATSTAPAIPAVFNIAPGIDLINPDGITSTNLDGIIDNNSYLTFDASLVGTTQTIHIEAMDSQGNVLAGDGNTVGNPNDISVTVNVDSPATAESVILNLASVPPTEPVVLFPVVSVTMDTTSPQFTNTLTGSINIDTSSLTNPMYSFDQTNGTTSSELPLVHLISVYQGQEFPAAAGGSGDYLSISLTGPLFFFENDSNSSFGTSIAQNMYTDPLNLYTTSTGSYILVGPDGIDLYYDPSHTLSSIVPLGSGATLPGPFGEVSGTVSGVTVGSHNGIPNVFVSGIDPLNPFFLDFSETIMDPAGNHMTASDEQLTAQNILANNSPAVLSDFHINNLTDAINFVQNAFVPLETVAMMVNSLTGSIVGIEVASYGSSTTGILSPSLGGISPGFGLNPLPDYFSLQLFGSSPDVLFNTTTAPYISPSGASYPGLGSWIQTMYTNTTPPLNVNTETGLGVGSLDTFLGSFQPVSSGMVEAQPFVPAISSNGGIPDNLNPNVATLDLNNPYGGQNMLQAAEIAATVALGIVSIIGLAPIAGIAVASAGAAIGDAVAAGAADATATAATTGDTLAAGTIASFNNAAASLQTTVATAQGVAAVPFAVATGVSATAVILTAHGSAHS